MKTIQYIDFGGSEVIRLTETGMPQINSDEILIEAAAVSVNPADIKFRSGAMQHRLPIQLPYIPGLDVAGKIIAIGSEISRLKVGDIIFGGKFGGTYSEYVALKENNASVIPQNTTINEAVSLVIPLITAYSFIVENAQVKEGQRVLIHGAAGGTGNVMLQMAKALGAYVIGTASGEGLSIVKSYGADEIIDYKAQDFTSLVKDVDVVIDMAGGETLQKSFPVLKKGGKLFSAVMPPSEELAVRYGVEARFISSGYSYVKLDFGKDLVEKGFIKPQIAKTMRFEDAAQAQDIVSAGGINGKVVLQII